jgi:hypothetical protein
VNGNGNGNGRYLITDHPFTQKELKMSTSYTQAKPGTYKLLEEIVGKYHQDLKKFKVIIGVLMAGNPDGNAITHGGYPAAAKIKIVSLKDRLTKKYDVELLLDDDHWEEANEEERIALLDHELSHLEICFNKGGGVKLDDLGRPKLKIIPGDIIQSDGFKDVIKRHGDNAPEVISHRNASLKIESARKGEDD